MDDRREMRELVSPERAREVLAGLDVGGGAERVPLREASGRVLAERVDADLDVPGFDRASYDGYAVRAADTRGAGEASPVTLDLVGTVAAGDRPDAEVREGEAVEVATGAVVPPGANAVVMVEDTDATDGGVAVRTAVPPGGNVMAAGADVAAGDRALGRGVRLTPRTIGLLAALGWESVPVRTEPRVAVVATGDELVQPGEKLDHERGQIYDVNTTTVATAVREAGGDPVTYTSVDDDRDALRETLVAAAAECDLVVTAGSTSAGAEDLLYRVVEETGELLVHGVAIKPGRPTMIGRVEGTAYVGLPGYPVSALSVFRLFVAPRIREAAGLPTARATRTTGRLAVTERYAEGRHRALPVGLVTDGDGATVVYPVDRGSGATTTLAAADGVVEMAADTQELAAGDRVTVDLFSADARPPALLAVGESDPAANRLLDGVERGRYLPDGSRTGRRWLRDGVADVGVVTGDGAAEGGEVLAAWQREWGVVAPADANAREWTELLRELVDRDRVATVDADVGLREAVADATEAAGLDVADLAGVETAGIESPARRVQGGRADAGVGLRATATRLGLSFAPVGRQRVAVVAAPDRTDKAGVAALRARCEDLDGILADLAGYER